MLSDANGKVCEKYGVIKEKVLYGKRVKGIERSTFVVGEDGRIAAVWRRVKVDGHVAEVLGALG